MDAKKEKIAPRQAVALARSMARVVAVRGAKTITIDIKKDRPDDAALEAVIVGNSGNLRAPTMKVGSTLLVGFNADTYDTILR